MRDALIHSRLPNRLRDFGVYVLVSVVCVGSIIVAAMEGVPERKFMPWFGFALFTLFLFGQFILKSRRLWKKKSFWLATGLFFLVHVITFTKVVHAGWEIPGGEWVLLVLVEMAILIIFRRLAFRGN